MAESRRIAELPIETPLGDDAVTLVSIDGTEKISDLFHFTLKLASEDANIDLNRLVGKALNFGIRTRDREDIRWWNGYVCRARALPEADQVYFYEVEVVPWLWFLTKTSDCVVHQEKKVLEIIKDVFHKYSFQDFEDRTEDQYTKWEYCTQYRESAFSFVSRLMETEGIFYFFKHEKGKHTLVMADRSTVFQPSKHQENVKVRHAFGAGARRSEDMILKWEFHSAFRSGKYTHWDYNFLKPENPLRAEMPAKRKKEAASKYEIYDYPGEYEEHKDGDDWARLRMESEELGNEVCRAESDVRALSAGCKFNLSDHDRRDQNKTYYITEIHHEAKEAGLYGGSRQGPAEYKNTFSCLDVNVQYRPERKTPKHIMRGVQTATVVGPKGEEIYTDEYGRVKVQFHWDRLGKKDQDSSCWMRVSHGLAGKGFGAVFLPRVGQEVLVDFIEGDPDRPIITGRVYNASQTHPWELPKNKNWSGVRTRSTKGGGPENYNEIRFDDTKGAEVFAMHAERDMQILVERNMLVQVDKNCHEAILGERRQSIQKNNSITIEGNHAEKISGSQSTKVSGSVELDADGNVTVKAGGNITIKAGGSMTIEAGTSITIKAGSGRITVGALGVTADGSLVLLNCGSPDMSMPNMPLGKSPSAPELIEKLKAGALGGGGGAAAGMAGALGAAASGVAGAAAAAAAAIGGAMQAGLGQAAGLLSAASQIASQSGLSPEIMKGLKEVAGQASQSVTSAAKAAAEAAAKTGQPLMGDAQKLEDMAKKLGDAAGKAMEAASEEGKAALKKLQESAGDLSQAAGKAKEAAGDAAKAIGEQVGPAVESAQKAVEKVKETTEKALDKAVDTAKKGAEQAVDKAAEAAGEAAKQAQQALEEAKDAASKAAEAAAEAAQSAGEKLSQAGDAVKSAAEKAIEDLKEAAPELPDLPDLGSPFGGAPSGPAAPPSSTPPPSSAPEDPFGPPPATGGPFESILG